MSRLPRRPDSTTPAYLRIASVLAGRIRSGAVPPPGRLPSERSLSEEFGVNRQTVRSALHLLREQGLAVTDRRGTYAVRTDAAAAPAFTAGPLLPAVSAGSRQGAMFAAPVTSSLGRLLGVPAGRPVLIHRHRVFTATGDPYGDALTYFAPITVLEVPELSRYLPRLPVDDPDLRLLAHWIERAGLTPAVTESITLSRSDHKSRSSGPTRLSVRSMVHDQHARLLTLTDLDVSPSWRKVTFEYVNPQATAHHLTPAPDRAGLRAHADTAR